MSKKQAILTKVFGDPQKKNLKRLTKKVDEINNLADKYAAMTKRELADLMRKVGLEDISVKSHLFGSAARHRGRKPFC